MHSMLYREDFALWLGTGRGSVINEIKRADSAIIICKCDW